MKYYAPYKGVFSGSAFCVGDHQFCGSGISADPSQSDKNAVLKVTANDLTGTASYRGRIAFAYVCNTGVVQVLCDVSGAYDGSKDGAGYRQELFEHYEKLSFSYYNQHNSVR